MAKFDTKIRTRSGLKSLTITSKTRADAVRIASNHGHVLNVKRVANFDIVPGMTTAERYQLLRTLAMMMAAKAPVPEALKIIANTFGGNIRMACRGLLQQAELGLEMPDAMELDRKNFPLMTTALVKAGWYTGQAWSALTDAAEFEYRMKNAAKSAMGKVWAAIGTFFLAAVMLFATTRYGGPMVLDNPVFRNNPATHVEWAVIMGDATEVLMGLTLALCLFFLFAGTIGRRISPGVVDRMILKIPYFSELVLAKNNQLTFYRLSLLLKSGIQMDTALELSVQSTPASALREDLGKALGALRKGRPWADELTSLQATDRAALKVAPNTEDQARTMNLLSDYYSDLYLQRINAFAPGIAFVAVLYMIVTGLVMFGQMMLPMLKLAAAI